MIPCTLRQLEIFVAAAEDCHFVRTANRLGISQPAVTSHILNLEGQLGRKLFIRRKGGTPVLSADGLAFLRQARSFLGEGSKIRDFRTRQDSAERATVRVCAGAHLLEDCLKPNMSSFCEAYPDMTLECVPVTTPIKGTHLLERGIADLMLFTVARPESFRLHAEVLRPVRFGLYAGEKFRQWQQASAEEISTLPFILPFEGTEEDLMVQTALMESGILCSNIAARAQFTDVILQMARRNHGVAALFETMVGRDPGDEELFKFDVELAPRYRTLFRLNNEPTPAMRTVEAYLRGLLAA